MFSKRDKQSAQESADLNNLQTLWKHTELIFGKPDLVLIDFSLKKNKEDDAHEPEYNGQSQQIAQFFPHKVCHLILAPFFYLFRFSSLGSEVRSRFGSDLSTTAYSSLYSGRKKF